MWLKPEPGIAPQERYLVGPMQRVARFSMRHARGVVLATVGFMVVAAIGAVRLRVDTNHINFFAEDHPLHQSAVVIDEQLSGIYSFNVLLEGPPDSMKSPDALRRMEELRAAARDAAVRAQGRVGGRLREAREPRADRAAAPRRRWFPTAADAIAQELFVFGLSDEGRA